MSAPPDVIVIGGHAYSWRAILAQRRVQLEEWKAAQMRQPALFDRKDDRRPGAERTAAGRYQEPTLLALLRERDG